jgi:hypothetical protein
MIEARDVLAATLLPDGKVLLAGSGGQPATSAEL